VSNICPTDSSTLHFTEIANVLRGNWDFDFMYLDRFNSDTVWPGISVQFILLSISILCWQLVSHMMELRRRR